MRALRCAIHTREAPKEPLGDYRNLIGIPEEGCHVLFFPVRFVHRRLLFYRMNSPTDQELLREYAGRRSEAAFAELVRRHVDFVYSAALRMVADAHLAEDVSQGVFVALAQNAGQLTNRPVLSGWLHRTAQNLAANVVRSDVRRRAREQEVVAMNEVLASEPNINWEHIAPHLDAALAELSEVDRDALFLRYFERKSAREMAEVLGTSEDAAQRRVSRAVERLREFFAKRGVTVGASGLLVVISTNAVQAAPVGLAATISIQTSIAIAATKTIAMTTIQKSLIAATLAAAIGTGIYEAYQASRWRDEAGTLRRQQAALAEQISQLKSENESFSNRVVLNSERLRELLRLRGETALLRREKRELEAAFAALAKEARAGGPVDAGINPQPTKAAPFQVQLVQDEPGENTEIVSSKSGDSGEIFHVQKTPLLDYTAIRSATVISDQISGAPQIVIEFSPEGRDLFAEITRANINKRLAMVLDGQLYSAPVIKSEIPGGTAQISGSFSEEEARELAGKINDVIAIR
jgi:RNA polymerase sigma factor (sigma-70 family)